MKKGEVGQALLWVLIILAVGVSLLYPGLGLAYSSLKVNQIATQNVRSLYLAEAAQEYVVWQLSYNNLAANMNNSGDNETLQVEICGNSADVLVVLRAVETEGAIAFATKHVIKPTITVYPDEVLNNTFNEYTFDITLEQLSDNTTQGLDAIYHVLPKGFETDDYVVGSSYIRYGNGPWESVGDPAIEQVASQQRLLWPARWRMHVRRPTAASLTQRCLQQARAAVRLRPCSCSVPIRSAADRRSCCRIPCSQLLPAPVPEQRSVLA